MADPQNIPAETRWRDLRTGMVFVLGIVLAGTLGLIIGKNTGLLTRHDTVHVFLPDIKGLTEGNMVTISGKKVGTVALMRFETHADTPGVRIDLDIRDEYFHLISTDSRAVVKALGVLGDKYVDIQLGRSSTMLADGGWLPAMHAAGFDELTVSAIGTMGQIQEISARINRGEGTVGKLVASDELANKLLASADNIEHITAKIQHGEGLAGKVLNDRRMADNAGAIVENLDAIVTGLREGKGTAGRLLNDSTMYTDLRHVLGRTETLLGHLNDSTGTAGRLMTDPSAYNELTRSLRALDSLLVDLKANPGRYVRVSVF